MSSRLEGQLIVAAIVAIVIAIWVVVECWSAIRQWWYWAWRIATVFASTVIIIWITETNLSTTAANHLNFVFQTLSGNWSPGEVYSSKTLPFSILAVLALIINLGSYIALFELLRRTLRIQEQTMKREAALLMRDVLIKRGIFESGLFKSLSSDLQHELQRLISHEFDVASDRLVTEVLPLEFHDAETARRVWKDSQKSSLRRHDFG